MRGFKAEVKRHKTADHEALNASTVDRLGLAHDCPVVQLWLYPAAIVAVPLLAYAWLWIAGRRRGAIRRPPGDD